MKSMKSVIPVWALALLGAIIVAVLVSPGDYLVFLPVVLGVVTLVTFGVQLGIRQTEGFVLRVTASVAGAFAILALASVVLGPLSLMADRI